MRVAFYAPMKPPDHPVPSGDRRMAALLAEALSLAGHEVELACRLRSRDPRGDPHRQERMRALGLDLGRRLVERYRRRPETERPAAWFTYHLYYKAPDWLGPAVSRALGIPYIVAEASVANKRAGGPWDAGHRATLAALDQAARVIALNSADLEALPDTSRAHSLKPFLDTRPFEQAARQGQTHRADLAKRFALDEGKPWLIAVAMMREGDKLASYRVLAEALAGLEARDWQLLLVGDGTARADIEKAFAKFDPGQVRFLGETTSETLPGFLSACDLFVWPAINEAYGMALLEAQACGLPVVAGRTGGVPDIVQDGQTGVLAEPGDVRAFRNTIESLLAEPSRRAALGSGALKRVAAHHGLAYAADRLDRILAEAVAAS